MQSRGFHGYQSANSGAAPQSSVLRAGVSGAACLFKQGQTLHRQGEGQLILPGATLLGQHLLIVINWRFVSTVNYLGSPCFGWLGRSRSDVMGVQADQPGVPRPFSRGHCTTVCVKLIKSWPGLVSALISSQSLTSAEEENEGASVQIVQGERETLKFTILISCMQMSLNLYICRATNAHLKGAVHPKIHIFTEAISVVYLSRQFWCEFFSPI